jgi:hypothetical protein
VHVDLTHLVRFGGATEELGGARKRAGVPTAFKTCSAPVTLMYRRVPQSTHMVAPSAPEYLPSPQSTHADAPAAEFLPAPQSIQEVTLVAPVFPEYLPSGHLAKEQSPSTRPMPFMLQASRRSLSKVPKGQEQVSVLQNQHPHSPLTHFEAKITPCGTTVFTSWV